VEERRAHARRPARIRARVGASPELALPRALTVDISRGGVLLAFDEPVGLAIGHAVVLSLDLPSGHFHALGRATRAARGCGFRSYVAFTFERVHDGDLDDLCIQLDRLALDTADEPNTPGGGRDPIGDE
jgi:hypothetical protein